MKHYFLFILLLINLSVYAQPEWKWAREAGDQLPGFSKNDKGFRSVTDNNNNTYVSGIFCSDSIKFGTISLYNQGLCNLFLVKYDSSGTALWAKSIEGTNDSFDDYPGGMAIDTEGNVYVAGNFRDTIKNTTPQLISNGYIDIFIVKFNPQGTITAAHSIGSADDNDDIADIVVDKNGNIYMTGSFYSSAIDFDGILTLKIGRQAFYVAKYNPSFFPRWVKTVNANSKHSYMSGQAIDVSNEGKIAVSGYFSGINLSIGDSVFQNEGVEDVFLAQLDSSGNFEWVKYLGSNGNDYSRSIKFDKDENVLVTGNFNGNVLSADTINLAINHGPSLGLLSGSLYLLKYDKQGKIKWGIKSQSTVNDLSGSYDLALDNMGNSYITGSYASNMILGKDTLHVSWAYNTNLFTAKIDKKGRPVWALAAEGNDSDIGFGISITKSGSLNTTGSFRSQQLIIGPDTLLNNSNYYNYFIARIDQCSGIVDLGPNLTIPNYGFATIKPTTTYDLYCWSNGDTTGSVKVFGNLLGIGEHIFHLTATDENGCSGTDSVKITVLPPTGIESVEYQNNISIYPVPANFWFFVETPYPANLGIYNANGALCKTLDIKTGTTKVNTNGLAPGTYYVKCSSERNLETKVLIIE